MILQPYDMEVGAGTFHPATTLRSLGPDYHWRAAYVRPSRRPTDKPFWREPEPAAALLSALCYQTVPADLQGLYLGSLKAIGLDPDRHDIRFVEDDWDTHAGGLGLWLGGMARRDGSVAIYHFQQVGGLNAIRCR